MISNHIRFNRPEVILTGVASGLFMFSATTGVSPASSADWQDETVSELSYLPKS